MPPVVPLRVSVRLDLHTGEAAGERRHRLSSAFEAPDTLYFESEQTVGVAPPLGSASGARIRSRALPILGEAAGRARFVLPLEEREVLFDAEVTLRFDPERADQGVRVTLLELDEEQREALERYVLERLA